MGGGELRCGQVLALILMLHRRVRVQGHSLACLLLLRVQDLDAVRQLPRPIELLILLYLSLTDELLLTLRYGVLLLWVPLSRVLC